MLDGTHATGNETFFTNPFGSTSTTILLNDSADTVYGVSGTTTVDSGSGANVFGFFAGQGGSETIFHFNAQSTLVFGGFGDKPIASEDASSGSDIIKLTDGTTITLDGIDHKVFNNIGS